MPPLGRRQRSARVALLFSVHLLVIAAPAWSQTQEAPPSPVSTPAQTSQPADTPPTTSASQPTVEVLPGGNVWTAPGTPEEKHSACGVLAVLCNVAGTVANAVENPAAIPGAVAGAVLDKAAG